MDGNKMQLMVIGTTVNYQPLKGSGLLLNGSPD